MNVELIISCLGLIITAVSFGAGCFFFVLAVRAYSHVRNIENLESSVKGKIEKFDIQMMKSTKEILENEKKGTDTIGDLLNLIDIFIGYQIYSSDIDHGKKTDNFDRDKLISRRNSLLRYRGRLALRHRGLEPERRENLIREMSVFATEEDIDLIEYVSSDNEEKPEIRFLAKRILKDIKK